MDIRIKIDRIVSLADLLRAQKARLLGRIQEAQYMEIRAWNTLEGLEEADRWEGWYQSAAFWDEDKRQRAIDAFNRVLDSGILL